MFILFHTNDKCIYYRKLICGSWKDRLDSISFNANSNTIIIIGLTPRTVASRELIAEILDK